jgi:hypothetical protein
MPRLVDEKDLPTALLVAAAVAVLLALYALLFWLAAAS